MAHISLKKRWQRDDLPVTDEHAYWGRREFIRAVGLAGLAGATFLAGANSPDETVRSLSGIAEAGRSAATILGGNYVEFSSWNAEAALLAQAMNPQDWPITIGGLVQRPMTIEAGALTERMQQEERTYRFRCIEGWNMTVPWTGFSLRSLLEWVQPLSNARFVRFDSFHLPEIAPGQASGYYASWPYGEILTLDEAMHELTFLASGVYGTRLPKHNGAPLRLVVPWKYATKSVKAVTRIQFLDSPTPTFWQANRPAACDFFCNVDPHYPHSSVPQGKELIVGTGQWQNTRFMNGYADLVASLYA
jgi:methionine sulfoxide reductase catalytic subunit